MPIKCLVLMKKKPGMSAEEFRHRYETGHSRLAIKYYGHLWSEYRRYYLTAGLPFAAESGFPTGEGPQLPYDAISEVVFPDQAAVDECNRIQSDPEVCRVLEKDGEATFDRVNSWMIMCDMIEEDLPAAIAAERRKEAAQA